jgi:transglutaminase/protease-like cytokinesis protein 3
VLNVALDQHSIELKVGESAELKVTVSPSFASGDDIKWNSSDESVATVTSSGKVTAQGLGTAEITVYASGGKTASCLVTVKECDHSYGEWIISTEALCNKAGTITRKCIHCEKTESTNYDDDDNHKFVNGSCVYCAKNAPDAEDSDKVTDTPIIDWEAD